MSTYTSPSPYLSGHAHASHNNNSIHVGATPSGYNFIAPGSYAAGAGGGSGLALALQHHNARHGNANNNSNSSSSVTASAVGAGGAGGNAAVTIASGIAPAATSTPAPATTASGSASASSASLGASASIDASGASNSEHYASMVRRLQLFRRGLDTERLARSQLERNTELLKAHVRELERQLREATASAAAAAANPNPAVSAANSTLVKPRTAPAAIDSDSAPALQLTASTPPPAAAVGGSNDVPLLAAKSAELADVRSRVEQLTAELSAARARAAAELAEREANWSNQLRALTLALAEREKELVSARNESTAMKAFNEELARRSFWYKQKVESMELKLRLYHVEKVTATGATLTAQIIIKKLPASGELLICVISGDLPFEYQSDIGTCKIRALDVEVESFIPNAATAATATASPNASTALVAGSLPSQSTAAAAAASPPVSMSASAVSAAAKAIATGTGATVSSTGSGGSGHSPSPQSVSSSLGSHNSLSLKDGSPAGGKPLSASAAIGASAAAAAAAPAPVQPVAGTMQRLTRHRFILAFRTDGKRMVFQSNSAAERDECVEQIQEFISIAPTPVNEQQTGASAAPPSSGGPTAVNRQ